MFIHQDYKSILQEILDELNNEYSKASLLVADYANDYTAAIMTPGVQDVRDDGRLILKYTNHINTETLKKIESTRKSK
jgi:hypothetical protein